MRIRASGTTDIGRRRQRNEDAFLRLYELAHSNSQYAGMGTTMTMLIVVDDKAIMSHVGDRRLYLLREGRLHLLSSDHTLANEMLQRGTLADEDYSDSPYRHVRTRSVGNVGAMEAEMLLFDILPGDTFLLCSDGLSNDIEDADEIVSFLDFASP
jgi:protein phosphatase